jgi:hypothetical protein
VPGCSAPRRASAVWQRCQSGEERVQRAERQERLLWCGLFFRLAAQLPQVNASIDEELLIPGPFHAINATTTPIHNGTLNEALNG